MAVSTAIAFAKTTACPSSGVLVSYRSHTLAPEIMRLIKHHLSKCDFCCAELPLLAFYRKPRRGECKTPEIPINLRILAESLFFRSDRLRKKPVARKPIGIVLK